LVRAVANAKISDAKLRDQAMRAVQSTALNCAEGAGRLTRPDKTRAFAIARGECVEACAAVEIAMLSGCATAASYSAVESIAQVLYAMLTKLIR
jgi:four helix bundle protein